jgi:glutamate racemase
MLRNIISGNFSSRKIRTPDRILPGARVVRHPPAHGTGSSCTPDLTRLPPRLSHRYFHTGQVIFFPQGAVKDDFYTKIVVEKQVFAAHSTDGSKSKAAYTPATRQVISTVEQLTVLSRQRKKDAIAASQNSDDLLGALDVVLNSKKVMLFTGKNTLEGKVTPSGPVATALLAHALYQSHKVAVIVCDDVNWRLTRCLLHAINPDCARYIKHFSIKAVNGELFGQLRRMLDEEAPDTTIYVGVPGRNHNGAYLDEAGNPIDDFNIALDQALNLQNAQQKQTIAICSRLNDAGAGSPLDKNNEKHAGKPHTVMSASHTVIADDVLVGGLALAELTTSACIDKHACTPEELERIIKKAEDKVKRDDYRAPCYRDKPRAKHHHLPVPVIEPLHSYIFMARLKEMQDAIELGQVAWPSSLDHLKDYGPEVRYFVLYDSSDGAFIALRDFEGYFRARSNSILKLTLVTDHNNAPYGALDDELFGVAVNGMYFSAKQGPEGIVMVCNTVCTVDLEKVKDIVEKAFEKACGKKIDMALVDLIKTTAEAIIKHGGDRPVILCTERTAKSGAYQKRIKEAAEPAGKAMPNVTVIGCGDKDNEELKRLDWASLINDGVHLKTDEDSKRLIETEVRRYVTKISPDATSIWFGCTHFPPIKSVVRNHVDAILKASGKQHSIRIFDPIEFQAEKTIKYANEHPLAIQDRHAFKPETNVVTTGRVAAVKKSVKAYNKKPIPVSHVVFEKVKEEPAVIREALAKQ